MIKLVIYYFLNMDSEIIRYVLNLMPLLPETISMAKSYFFRN